MFLPLHDGVLMRRLNGPIVTWGVIALNALIHLAAELRVFDDALLSLGYGAIPALITGARELEEGIPHLPAYATTVSSQFLHADWFHLGSNMLFLYIFGDNVEDAMGHLRFLAFYLLCGVAGVLAYVAVDPSGIAPLIGASGAISGVVAAYLLLYPRVHVFGLVFSFVPLRLRAVHALGFWILLQVVSAVVLPGDDVAYVAHVGGAVAGGLLVLVLRSPGVPLLGRYDGR